MGFYRKLGCLFVFAPTMALAQMPATPNPAPPPAAPPKSSAKTPDFAPPPVAAASPRAAVERPVLESPEQVAMDLFRPDGSAYPPLQLPNGLGDELVPAAPLRRPLSPLLTPPPRPAGLPSVDSPEAYVVRLFVRGRRGATGVVLRNGHILAALSTLGHGRNLSAKFTDGSRRALTVVRSFRGYDLALLRTMEPLAGGLPISGAGLEIGHSLHWNRAKPHKQLLVSVREFTAIGMDAVALPQSRIADQQPPVGSAVVNDAGHLVGFYVRACVPPKSASQELHGSGSEKCREDRVILDVGLIANFTGGTAGAATWGWLGLKGVASDAGWVRGVRVLGFEHGSPGVRAGIIQADFNHSGDLVVALEDVPVRSVKRLNRLAAAYPAGKVVKLLVLRSGRFETVPVTLSTGAQLLRRDANWEIWPPLIQPPSPWLGF